MKVGRIIKILEKFTLPLIWTNCTIETLDKIISISKDAKPPLSRFLSKSKSNRVDGYSHIMTKTERYSRSVLPSAI